MKVLITGATGFVGCHAVDHALRDGHQVGVLARNPQKQREVLAGLGIAPQRVTIHHGDVLDCDWTQLLPGYQALIHSAGLMSKDMADADKLQALNVTASDRLLRAAVEQGLDPVIHVSSLLALFPPAGPVVRAEDPVAEPSAMYSRTKAQAERYARALQSQGSPVVCVYPASVSGPQDPTVGSGQAFFANGINGGRMLVTEGGLSFTDVRDLACLLARLLEPGRGPRRVMATADYLTHQQILDLMREQSGRQIEAITMPGWLMRLMGRLADLKQKLFGGPTPDLTYETALVLTRCVPQEDSQARAIIGDSLIGGEQSLRDTVDWLCAEGIIKPRATNTATQGS